MDYVVNEKQKDCIKLDNYNAVQEIEMVLFFRF